ncbi:hypothetical protein D3C85_1702650 [compost metagenome]
MAHRRLYAGLRRRHGGGVRRLPRHFQRAAFSALVAAVDGCGLLGACRRSRFPHAVRQQ